MRGLYYIFIVFLFVFLSCQEKATGDNPIIPNNENSERLEFMLSNYTDNLPRVVRGQENRKLSLYYILYNHSDSEILMPSVKQNDLDVIFFQVCAGSTKGISLPASLIYKNGKKAISPHGFMRARLILLQYHLQHLGFDKLDSWEDILKGISVSYVTTGSNSDETIPFYMTRKEVIYEMP
jgi:hypothetical protein